jgi:hypothetical protein
MSDVMEPSGASWNWGLVNGMFNNHDIEVIHKIGLLNREGEDNLIWRFNQ